MIYVMGLAALSLAWLLPGHYFPWTSFQQEVLAAMGVSLIGVAALVSTENVRLLWPRLTIATALLAVVPLAQWAAGLINYVTDALLPALYLLAFSLAVLAAASVYEAKGSQFVAWLFGCFLAAAIASMGIALTQWLHVGSFDWIEAADSRIYANLVQPNHFASLLGLAAGATLWFYETRRVSGLTASLAFAFLGLGLVMAQSRTGWLAIAAIGVWVVYMRDRLALRTTRTGALGALAGLAVALALWQSLNDFLLLSSPLSLANRLHDGIRPIMWASLLDAAWREPWFGYGWGQVSIAQQATALDHPASRGGWTNYSHNVLIDLLIWNGIPLGLLVIGMVTWWVWSRVRGCKDVDTWAALAASAALLVHAMVEFPLAYLYFLLPLALMVGIIESQHARQAPSDRARYLPRPVFGLSLAVLCGALAWICVEYVDLEEAARRLRLKEAGYIANGQVPTVPDLMLLDGQREFIRLRLTEAKPEMTPAQVDWMREVSQRFAPPAAMLRYALAAGLNHREAEAELTLGRLCKIWPPRNCDEGRVSWYAAQQKFEALRAIPFPATEGAPHAVAASH